MPGAPERQGTVPSAIALLPREKPDKNPALRVRCGGICELQTTLVSPVRNCQEVRIQSCPRCGDYSRRRENSRELSSVNRQLGVGLPCPRVFPLLNT